MERHERLPPLVTTAVAPVLGVPLVGPALGDRRRRLRRGGCRYTRSGLFGVAGFDRWQVRRHQERRSWRAVETARGVLAEELDAQLAHPMAFDGSTHDGVDLQLGRIAVEFAEVARQGQAQLQDLPLERWPRQGQRQPTLGDVPRHRAFLPRAAVRRIADDANGQVLGKPRMAAPFTAWRLGHANSMPDGLRSASAEAPQRLGLSRLECSMAADGLSAIRSARRGAEASRGTPAAAGRSSGPCPAASLPTG